MAETLPHTAEKLLANIPRLEPVRIILRYQNKNFDGSGSPRDNVKGEEIPMGARILKLVLDFDILKAQRVQHELILDTLRGRNNTYAPALLETFLELQGGTEREAGIKEIGFKEVRLGMVFAEDVTTKSGVLLIPRGQEVTPLLCVRIQSFSENTAIKEPLRVIVPRSPSPGANEPEPSEMSELI